MSNAMLDAIWPLQMPAPKKAVLVALADRANDLGVCYPSVGDVCKRTCLGERTVQDALNFLEGAGVLKRTFRSGSSTLIEVTPEGFKPLRATHPRMSRTPATDAGEGCATRTTTPAGAAPTPAGAAPRTIINHQLNHQGTINTRATRIESTDNFAEFWKVYPRKTAKQKAEQAWKKLKPGDAMLAKILAALRAQKTSPQWTKDGGQFVPHASTWLNQRRWEDEVSERSSQAGQPIAYDPSVADVIAGAMRSAA